MAAASLPRWFLVLPLCAVAIWLPVDPYWQSDDYLALHYAQDLGRALADFAGPQYGATEVWWFYRPLITLSFWLEQALAGPSPWLSLGGNVAAHGASALLVGLVWRRFLPDVQAFAAALLWAAMPSHVGSISWAVGRVDSHTTVWCLACILLALRADERRAAGGRPRPWPVLLAAAAGLWSKELAVATPAVAALAVFCRPLTRRPPAARARAAVAATWPAWVALALYALARTLALGRLGGYAASAYQPAAMAAGLGKVVADLAVPLRWTRDLAGPTVPAWTLWVATAPPVAAAAVSLARRLPVALGAGAAFVVAALPMAAFFAAADNPHTLRLYYLPAAALVGWFAAGGRTLAALVLVAWAGPLLLVRAAQADADRESARLHATLVRTADQPAPDPMFVAGLPRSHSGGTTVQLHFGVDRLLLPPFRAGSTRLLALRPLAAAPAAVRLWPDGEPPFALPLGSTWWFADSTALGRAPPPPLLPDLPIAGDDAGALDLTTPRLDALLPIAVAALANGEPTFGLELPGIAAPALRATIFTACGYLACLLPNHAAPGAVAGRLDVLRLFAGDPRRGFEPGRIAWREPLFVGDALVLPVTMDLVPEFPCLVEAGELHGPAFVATHRARRLLTLRFDRGYPGWVRRAQGTGR